MKYTNLGKFNSIDKYVEDKLNRLSKLDKSFDALIDMMFEDENNIFFEETSAFRVKKTTYKEAGDNIDIIAKNIKVNFPNAKHNDVIGLYLENSHIWIEAFWAILKCGFRPLFLNMRLSDEVLENALKLTNAVGVITENKIFKEKTLLVKDLFNKQNIEVNEKFGEELFVMSSGTTSNIKICAYSAVEIINILSQSRRIIKDNPLVKRHYEGELKLLAFLPFYHIFGFVAVYLWFSFYARTFVKLNDFNPSTIQSTIRRHKVTHIFAVPLFWQKVYDSAIREIKNKGDATYNKFLKGLKLSSKPVIGPLITKYALKEVRDKLFGDSISFLITGGSMIDKRVLTFFNAIGYHLSNGYGMSEIGITSVELSNNYNYLTTGSIGVPLPGVEYKINENNELSVRANSSAKYIIEGEEIHNLKDGFYLTHDLAKCVDGRYYLLGRQDDLVVPISGENLNPNIIENALIFDNLRGICLINGRNNLRPVLLVSIQKHLKKEKVEEILNELKNRLDNQNLSTQIGSIVFVTDSFIKGDEFKMNRKRIEQDYYDHKLELYSFENVQENDDEITIKIKEFFAEVLSKEVDDISSNSDFFLDEGGTSIDYYVIMSKINEEYNIDMTELENKLTKVSDIASYIKEKL